MFLKGEEIMHRSIIVFLCLIFLFISGCKPEKKVTQEKGQVVVSLGEHKITVEDLRVALKNLSPQEREGIRVNKALMDKFVEDMAYMEAMYLEAKRENLENDPDFKARLEQQRKLLLAQELIRKKLLPKLKVEDKEVKEYYDKNREHYKMAKRYKVSHLMVKDERDLQLAQERLKKGEPFEKVVRELSIDKESAQSGGSLGYLEEGRMPPEFEKVLKKMKVGQISEPVKTQFGWHLLKLEEIKEAGYVDYETMKESIRNVLLEEKRQKLIEEYTQELKKKYKIEINKTLVDELFLKGQI